MRMTNDTYKHLTLCLDEIIATAGRDRVIAYRNNVKFVKDQFVSFVWGMFRYIPQVDRAAIINNQGERLQDAHIETALKKALIEFK